VDVASHYVMKNATHLTTHGLYSEAARTLHVLGAPAEVSHLNLYLTIALGVLALPAKQRDEEAEEALKAVLFSLYNRLAVSSSAPS
jgi:hypothetical protein